jgi:hypothetical protein
VRSCGPNVANAGMGNRTLPVQDQTHRLHRFDGQRLVCLNERAVRRQVVHLNRIAGVKRSPERAEYFESDPRPTIPRRTHHHTCALRVCKPVTTLYLHDFYRVFLIWHFGGLEKASKMLTMFLPMADWIASCCPSTAANRRGFELITNLYQRSEVAPRRPAATITVSAPGGWCAQQDSNLQPLAPEANALSN